MSRHFPVKVIESLTSTVMLTMSPVLAVFIMLTTQAFADLQNQPRIFAKGNNLHIRSGDGDIVFEPSEHGKVRFGIHELNVTGSVGPPGLKGDKGSKGTNGTKGTVGDGGVGSKGNTGGKGDNGTTGGKGEKGAAGQKGGVGPLGHKGSQGDPGAECRPGPIGPEINIGPVTYYTDLNRPKEKCNISSVGILRYSSKGLQLCTTVGWRNIALENNSPRCVVNNIPEKNIQAFLNGYPGIMFQFNGNITPLVNPRNYNSTIKAELFSTNNNSGTPQVTYVDAVMRQAVYFDGKQFINVSGIPEQFWKKQNWTITALLKFGEINVRENIYIPVLGIGDTNNSHGIRLGIKGTPYNGKVTYGAQFLHNSDIDVHIGPLHTDIWYHLTWSSTKTSANEERRCLILDGSSHKCVANKERYSGNALTTIGSWSFGNNVNNLLLDQLIISSGMINYSTSDKDQQLCYAKLVDKTLP